MNGELIVAIDIETSGPVDDLISVGMAAVKSIGSSYKPIKYFRFGCYLPNITKFDSKCYNEFWFDKQDLLATFQYMGKSTDLAGVYGECISQLRNFLKSMEELAKETNLWYVLVSDNPSFDIGFLNRIIGTYNLGNTLNYMQGADNYLNIRDVFSMQRGLLLAEVPLWDEEFGCTKRMKKLFNTEGLQYPEFPFESDTHDPTYDALQIALDYVALRIIKFRRQSKRNYRNYVLSCLAGGIGLSLVSWILY